jgi:APA family basic amino acid/polyamine antiporter
MSLFRRKSLEALLSQAADSEKGLKRTLGAGNLIALGIGAIIGAGLFVRTAAAAGQAAGPGVTLSFVVAAIGCAFAGLCYAEFASMIPIAGSAYAYSYVTMGELVAWIIGWALIMEYALGAATVSIAWSEYLNKLLGGGIPYEWCHSPFESYTDSAGILHKGMINAPALVILLLLTLLLIKGTQESALVNAVIVFIKVAVVLIFIAIGWQFIDSSNYEPYLIPANEPAVVDQAGKVIADGTNTAGAVYWVGLLLYSLPSSALMRFPLQLRKPKTPSAICPLVSWDLWWFAPSCTFCLDMYLQE